MIDVPGQSDPDGGTGLLDQVGQSAEDGVKCAGSPRRLGLGAVGLRVIPAPAQHALAETPTRLATAFIDRPRP